MKTQLKTRQICFFFLSFTPITKFFILPSILAGIANEDMWLCAVVNVIFDLTALSAIIYTCKKCNCTFIELLENNLGKSGAKKVLILYFIYFMLKTMLPLGEQRDYVEFTLYTLKPTVLYFLPFFAVPFYLCTKKVRILGRLSDVLWLITINGFITLVSLSVTNADFGAILPVGARGAGAIFKGSISSLNWFGDCVYIMFLIGEFEYKKKDFFKIILSYLGGAVMIVAFMIIFYSIFTSIAFRQRFALTEISKYTTVINNLGRFDYIGIIMVLFSNIFAISLPIYFSCRILNKIFGWSNVYIAPAIVIGFQISFMLFFYQYYQGLENFVVNYAWIFFLIMSNVFPLLTPLFTIKEKVVNEKG